jgi:uncharacterized protein (DUF2236 family)
MVYALNNLIKAGILELVGGGTAPPVAFLTPRGDPGLFGPTSVVWRVHADFISMMIGGIGSLALQALHPKALAGVWDHSTFRQDLKGRLGRTAFFISATTYGPKEMAFKVIDKVVNIHKQVHGFDEMGEPYCASDPHLLKWVHLTETYSFLKSYQKYCQPKLNSKEVDQYFSEMKILGEMLGAKDLPDTLLGTEQAILEYKRELKFGERAQVIIDLLSNFPSSLHLKPVVLLITRAALTNLPLWAQEFIQTPKAGFIEKQFLNACVNSVAVPIRAALNNGVVAHSLKRIKDSHPRL